jgi:hypothetical protein
MLKMYGYYNLPWNATVGGYFIAQSGHPWEAWNYRAYPTSIVGTSTSDLIRYAEPAGSRVTSAHHQIDLNYTQNFTLRGRTRFQVVADLYNVFNNQTGYNPQPSLNTSTFGVARSLFPPRRLTLAAKIQF